MGTIKSRKRKNGTTAYMARIRINREGKPEYKETQTFDRRPAAAAWIARREDELAKPGAIERAKQTSNDPELSAVIDRYIAESEKEIGKTKAQPRIADEIFPYSAGAMSAAFTRACALLAIDDLHFHDLRHEGISWLFETGYNIPHAAAVSGHRSWTSLKRYTQLRQRGDKYAGWGWLDAVTTS